MLRPKGSMSLRLHVRVRSYFAPGKDAVVQKSLVTLAAILATGFMAISQATFAAEQGLSATDSSGLAAVYTDKLAGHKTASGKNYDPSKLTAAHRTLPFGTHVKVTNPANGKSVVVVITDRGPKQQDRVLDLSASAAHALGISKFKMAKVTLETEPATAASN